MAATARRYVPTPASTNASGYENQTPIAPNAPRHRSRRAVKGEEPGASGDPGDPDAPGAGPAASKSATRVSARSHEYCLISAE